MKITEIKISAGKTIDAGAFQYELGTDDDLCVINNGVAFSKAERVE